MNKPTRFFVIWCFFLAVMTGPAMAQVHSFEVDNTKNTSVTTTVDEEDEQEGDGLTEAEEDAYYAGDKSDITTEDAELLEKARENLEDDTLTPEAANVDQPEAEVEETEMKPDPCAAYTSARGKMLCEDRVMKIERMKAAKDKRTNIYAAPAEEAESEEGEDTPPAETPADTPAATPETPATNTQ